MSNTTKINKAIELIRAQSAEFQDKALWDMLYFLLLTDEIRFDEEGFPYWEGNGERLGEE